MSSRAPVTMREAAGLLSSFVKSALSTPKEGAKFAPEVLSILQKIEDRVRECSHENETESMRRIVRHVVWGESVEALCSAIESAFFFGLDPPAVRRSRGRYEYLSADFERVLKEIKVKQLCTACIAAWNAAHECGFVTTAQGRCRAWLRSALSRNDLAIVITTLGRLLEEESRGLWRRASILGDPAARLALCRILIPLNKVRLVPRINDPRLDHPLAAFDAHGILRRLETRDATALEVTLAGSEAVLGVYLLQNYEDKSIHYLQHSGQKGLLAPHALERKENCWIIRRKQQLADEDWPVSYYSSSGNSEWPPAAGWRCGPAGILPCPLLRRVRFEPNTTKTPPSLDGKDIATGETSRTASYEVPANSVVGTPSHLPRVRSRLTQCLAEIEDAIDDYCTTHSLRSVETPSSPEKDYMPDKRPWRIKVEERESRVACVAAKDALRRAALRELRLRLYEELCSAVVEGAVRAEESAEEAMRRWSLLPAKEQLRLSEEKGPSLEAALERARERPQDVRLNEARRARQVWRSACVASVRRITDGRSFVCVDIGCAGTAVVARSAVVWLVQIAIERGIPFFEDDDGLDLDSSAQVLLLEKDDDDPAETLCKRLNDGRLRRPRRVAVVRCSSRGLEALHRRLRGREEPFPTVLAQSLRSAEQRMLRRLDEANPLGRDRDMSAAALPAVQAVDAWLKDTVFGEEKEAEGVAVKLKLFVDDSYADEERSRSRTSAAATSSISLGIWLPIRSAGSANSEPPEPPALSDLEYIADHDDETDEDDDGFDRGYSTYASSMANLTPAAKKMVKGLKRAASSSLQQQQHYHHHHLNQEPGSRKLPLTFFESIETQLIVQGRRCACCGDEVLHASNLMGNNFAPCRLLDVLVCTKRCHGGDRRVLPWRAVLCGDFRPHRVSRAAAAFLDSRRHEPLLKLPPTAPIFRYDPSVDAARQLRIRLAEIRSDATIHGRAGAAEASTLLISKLGTGRIHLAIGPPDFWSLQDLIDASQGHLISIMSDIIADANETFASAFALQQTCEIHRSSTAIR